ncbi:MAG: D-glycero-beta-D-manno-heptose 1,7-bisphosphate 7-phosphatase [Anaerolineales bacterium]
MPALRPALFLDRDGVIIENRADYVKGVDEVRFIPGALEALARLAHSALRIVVVTNQSAVGRGLLTLASLETINAHLLAQVAAASGRIDGVYVCPHRPDEGCDCRKPAPGLLQRAARDLGIDLAASVMIGDAITDMLAAQAVGARPILVRTGLGATQELSHLGLPQVLRVPDLTAAIDRLLAEDPWLTKTPPSGGGV